MSAHCHEKLILPTKSEYVNLRIERISSLYTFMRHIETIQDIGWWEHTSDWDPYLIITLNTGKEIVHDNGPAGFELSDGKTKLDFTDYISQDHPKITHIMLCDDDDPNFFIEIDDIKQMEVEA